MSTTTDIIIKIIESNNIPVLIEADFLHSSESTWTCDLTGLIYTNDEWDAICLEPPYLRRKKMGVPLQGAWNYNWDYLSELPLNTELKLVADPDYQVGETQYPNAVKVFHEDMILGFVAESDNEPISRALLHGMFVIAVLIENRHGASYVRMMIEYDDLD